MKLSPPEISSRPNFRAPALRLCAALQRKNVDLQPTLCRLGVSPLLASDPTTTVNSQQMILLLKEAQTALRDEFFGLTRHPLKLGASHFMFESGLRCETLGTLIQYAVRFMRFASQDISVEFVQQQDEAALSMRLRQPECDPDQLLIDNLLLFWHRTLSWSVGYMIPVNRLDLTIHEPPSPERLSYWLHKDWRTGQPVNAFYFNTRYLTLPVVRTSQEWRDHLRHGASGQPEWPEPEQRWSLRLKALLRKDLNQRRAPSGLKEAAAALHVGAHTLGRNLRDEGTAYQQVLDQLRRDEAIEKLHVQHLSVADVAEQLGFVEARSFSRAFKQWTGVAPSRYIG